MTIFFCFHKLYFWHITDFCVNDMWRARNAEFKFLSFVLNAFPSTLPPIKNGCSTRRKGEDKTREDKTMNTHNTKTTTEHTNTSGNRIRKEEWRVIAVAPKYEVSNKGRIRNITTGRVLKAYINPRTGYEHVALSIGGAFKTKTVHRLVAIAFIPNPNNLP